MMYTLCDLIETRQYDASRQALVDGERRVSYAELADLAQCYAALLEQAGVGRGDRVAIYLGGVAVFINDILRSRQVNYILDIARSWRWCRITVC